MQIIEQPSDRPAPASVTSLGGTWGALAPFAVFLGGVAWLGLSGAPDETGFWPVLLAGLTVGMLLVRNRVAYADAVLTGMSQRIVMTMVMAWLLAGVLGSVLAAAGLLESLVELAYRSGVSGRWYVVTAFLVCALVSTATGTSLGTIIVCGPLLYPVGGPLAAAPATLMGAILGGATFGDNISPVSDTTIASASTQGADLGGVVRSRLRYAVTAATVAVLLYAVMGQGSGGVSADGAHGASLVPLVLLAVPAVVLGMLFRSRHLLEALVIGNLLALVLALATRSVDLGDVIGIDHDNFISTGIVLDGMRRGVGVSIFTILLMGLVGGLEAHGILARLLYAADRRVSDARSAEWWTFAGVSAAVLLTTHSVVAILAVGPLVSQTGEAHGVHAYRRANILDMTVCTYPFLLPAFIPTILAASTTAGAETFGMPRLTPMDVGFHNFHSWALLAVVLLMIGSRWGATRTVGTGESDGGGRRQ